MKKLIVITLTIIGLSSNAQIYKGKKDECSIHFLSKSPLEDIEATNKSAIMVLNTETSDIQFGVVCTQFKFKSALMEEHFNENYMESEKFPQSTFKGKINEKIDWNIDGENKVTVTGKMNMHGVTKDVMVSGTLTKKGNEVILISAFKIKIADYNIKVPSLYVQNIAETVDVDVKGVLEPFVKK